MLRIGMETEVWKAVLHVPGLSVYFTVRLRLSALDLLWICSLFTASKEERRIYIINVQYSGARHETRNRARGG